MTARDLYVKKLKAQLDLWNAEISKLEAKTKQSVVGAKDSYEKQLKTIRDQRSAMQQKVAEIQKAGDHAWDHMRLGADKAWRAMEESVKKAWSAFK